MAAFLFPRTKVKILELNEFFDATPYTSDEIIDSDGALMVGDHHASLVFPINETSNDIRYTIEVYANETSTGITNYVIVSANDDPNNYYKAESMSASPDVLDMDAGTVTMEVVFSLETGMVEVTGIDGVMLNLSPGGEPHQLGGTVEPAEATNQAIEWVANYKSFEGIDAEDFDLYEEYAEIVITDGDTIVVSENGVLDLTAIIRNGIDNRTDFIVNFEATAVCVDSLVTSIANMPTHVHGLVVDFSDAIVIPFTRTNQNIVFSVKEGDTTGAVINDRILTSTSYGDVTVIARVDWNDVTTGEAEFYEEEFTVKLCEVDVPVVTISDVPMTLVGGTTTSLHDVKVYPANATNTDIKWNALFVVGESGIASITESNEIMINDVTGEVLLTATIKDGLCTGEDYVKSFYISTFRSTSVEE